MKSLLLIIFLLISLRAASPDLNLLFIESSEPVFAFDRLIEAIVFVECGGNHWAYNVEEEATGPFQIRPIRLNDYNKRTGESFILDDCYNYEISKKIFLYYANLTGYPHYEKIAKDWNGSGPMTIDYWKKVRLKIKPA
jgi:hypothetical protein